MPPKRREKEVEASKNIKTEATGDHELFLNAFEKPTQIYRYLRNRSLVKPYFLHRNLTYMQHRMTRRKKNGKKISPDNLLEIVQTKQLQQKSNDHRTSGYLTLTYLGFYNQNNLSPKEPVKLETILLKVCHQKRKELSHAVLKVSLGTSYVAYNPSDENPPPKVPTVSIPAESFYLCGPKVKSSTILLRIVTNSSEHVMSSNSEESEPNPKKIRLSKDSSETVEFGMDLVVFDKHQRCSLKEGQYEFLLSEIDKRSNNDRCTRISTSFSSWEDLGEDKDMSKQHFSSFENISKGPTLKFHLQWAKEPVTSIVDRPPAFIPSPDEPVKPKIENNNVVETKFQESKTIIYQFSYNNSKSHQHTEASNDLICPWCWLNCITVFSLLWHLKLCHPRFNFHFTQVNKGMKIEVSLNENYDGSYSGCPTNPPRPGRPVKRTSLTHVMVCHPKRTKMKSLSELTDLEENDHENHRPYITGHNRLYHHATTCLPINPKEMDIDSEDEMDPRWLKQKTMMMIDEFTDVNEGEKELMKMWNLHVMKHGFVGDCQVPLACFMFLEEKGKNC
uniref:Polycomb protein Suz12 n=1 Tax=Lygus hesperus TaxID=30085 RepID=A0A0A9Z6A9_LYGHE